MIYPRFIVGPDFWGPGYRHVNREIWKVYHSYWNGNTDWFSIEEGVGRKVFIQRLPDQAEGEEHRDVF